MNGINFLNLELLPLHNRNGRQGPDQILTDGEIKAVSNALQEIALQYKGTGARVEMSLYKTTKHRTANGKKKKRGVIMATITGHYLQHVYFHFNPKTGKITGTNYGENKLYDTANPAAFMMPLTPRDAETWNDQTDSAPEPDPGKRQELDEIEAANWQAEQMRHEWKKKNKGATE